MFPIYGSNLGFTYDNLREVRLDPLWISLASTAAAAFLVVVALTESEPGPIQADDPSATLALVATVEPNDTQDTNAAP